jgi:hypothetical protein
VGGWWWGYWGWYWSSCAYWVPTYVEYDVGSLLIPVGLPIVGDPPPDLIFAGLAQSVVGSGGAPDETKARQFVQQIFAQWPDPRTCPYWEARRRRCSVGCYGTQLRACNEKPSLLLLSPKTMTLLLSVCCAVYPDCVNHDARRLLRGLGRHIYRGPVRHCANSVRRTGRRWA